MYRLSQSRDDHSYRCALHFFLKRLPVLYGRVTDLTHQLRCIRPHEAYFHRRIDETFDRRAILEKRRRQSAQGNAKSRNRRLHNASAL